MYYSRKALSGSGFGVWRLAVDGPKCACTCGALVQRANRVCSDNHDCLTFSRQSCRLTRLARCEVSCVLFVFVAARSEALSTVNYVTSIPRTRVTNQPYNQTEPAITESAITESATTESAITESANRTSQLNGATKQTSRIQATPRCKICGLLYRCKIGRVSLRVAHQQALLTVLKWKTPPSGQYFSSSTT